ncbi:hypothetical protein ACX3U9_00075 [Corynebacterium pyruviciproducens]
MDKKSKLVCFFSSLSRPQRWLAGCGFSFVAVVVLIGLMVAVNVDATYFFGSKPQEIGAESWDGPPVLVTLKSDYTKTGFFGTGLETADVRLLQDGKLTPLVWTGTHGGEFTAVPLDHGFALATAETITFYDWDGSITGDVDFPGIDAVKRSATTDGWYIISSITHSGENTDGWVDDYAFINRTGETHVITVNGNSSATGVCGGKRYIAAVDMDYDESTYESTRRYLNIYEVTDEWKIGDPLFTVELPGDPRPLAHIFTEMAPCSDEGVLTVLVSLDDAEGQSHMASANIDIAGKSVTFTPLPDGYEALLPYNSLISDGNYSWLNRPGIMTSWDRHTSHLETTWQTDPLPEDAPYASTLSQDYVVTGTSDEDTFYFTAYDANTGEKTSHVAIPKDMGPSLWIQEIELVN